MNKAGYCEYMLTVSPNKSGKVPSYVRAIDLLDMVFAMSDVFGLHGTSLFGIGNIDLLVKIRDFILDEARKMNAGQTCIFDIDPSLPKSYLRNNFCSAALQQLIDYAKYEQNVVAANRIVANESNAKTVSIKLLQHFDLTREGKDEAAVTKRRVGQSYFRRMILANYDNRCCLTGLNVPEVLRASHITAWASDEANRMNPENGLCLSATYDAAFDKHLITFDDDYRMVVSPYIRDFYTAQSTRHYFERLEGTTLTLPSKFLPSKTLLAKHRELLVG